jgi:hypothetical protein
LAKIPATISTKTNNSVMISESANRRTVCWVNSLK